MARKASKKLLPRALVNVVATAALCIVAVAIGHFLAAHLNGGATPIAQFQIEEEG
jgi:CrcB protein